MSTRAAGRWQREMRAARPARVRGAARAELEAHGYPVPDGEIASRRRAERWYRRHNQLLRNVNFVRLRVFQERGRELRFALARRFADPLRRQRDAR